MEINDQCLFILSVNKLGDFHLFFIKIQGDFVHFKIYVLYIGGHSPKVGSTCNSKDL